VEIVDALFINQYTLQLRTDLPWTDCADVDNNGTIDIVDAMMISQVTVDQHPEALDCGQISAPAESPRRAGVRTDLHLRQHPRIERFHLREAEDRRQP